MMTAKEARRLGRGSRVHVRNGGGAPWALARTYNVEGVISRRIDRRSWFVSFFGRAPEHDGVICIGSHQAGIFDITLESET